MPNRRESIAHVVTVVGMVVIAACASHTAGNTNQPAGTSRAVTVEKLERMTQQGEAVGVILGEIESSGTVYRLTSQQRDNLRADGMPVGIIDEMRNTYDRVVRQHPELAASNERWIKIGDYWYGGVPAGWPREWVTGAPAAPSR
jgi:hypothetical protein